MVGDSLVQQCPFDVGWRSLGRVGWPDASTTDDSWDPSVGWNGRLPMWTRLHDWTGTSYPYVTDPVEQVWWRDSGFKVVSLGTNDVKTVTEEDYRRGVTRLVDDAAGRPVIWVNTYNELFDDRVRRYNAILLEVARERPNLHVVDWHRFVRTHPTVPADAWRGTATFPLLSRDGAHVAGSEGCRARMDLVRAAMPAEPGRARAVGYWYDGPVRGQVNGWAADWTDRSAPAQVNVRLDWRHYTRLTAQGDNGDPYAQAAGGRAWGVAVPPGRHLVQVDLLAADGTWTSLGARWSE